MVLCKNMEKFFIIDLFIGNDYIQMILSIDEEGCEKMVVSKLNFYYWQ